MSSLSPHTSPQPATTDDGIDPGAGSQHAPWHHRGDSALPAILLLHGFTGSPSSMRPLAESLIDTGATVSVPRLTGHGGTWRQLQRSGWDDWKTSAVTAFDALAADHDGVVVVGQSMGGALAFALGVERTPRAIVAVNPALFVDSPLAPLTPVLWPFVRTVGSIGGDIEKPGAVEDANDRTPVRAVASLHRGLTTLRDQLWLVDCPVTVCVSGRDGVVAPRSLRTLRSGLGTSPRIVALRRSRHVATLDYDADVIAETVREALTAQAEDPT